MLRIFKNHIPSLNKILTFIGGFIAVLVIAIITMVQFNITGNYEGIFLLKTDHGALFEVQDDLYLGEEQRYIWDIDLDDWIHSFNDSASALAADKPSLYYSME